ncbi:MAG: ribosome assembly cofactor RimP [Bacteroidia bacterium]
MITKEQVKALVLEKIQGSSLFLVDIKVSASNKIEVFVDGDNGLAIKDCVELSRFIEKSLDRETEDFSLEVSSPGATAPLKMARQYVKHIGRDLEIVMNDGMELTGKLVNVNGTEEISIETTRREPKAIGKGKITVTETHTLNLNTIKESKIKLKF